MPRLKHQARSNLPSQPTLEGELERASDLTSNTVASGPAFLMTSH